VQDRFFKFYADSLFVCVHTHMILFYFQVAHVVYSQVGGGLISKSPWLQYNAKYVFSSSTCSHTFIIRDRWRGGKKRFD